MIRQKNNPRLLSFLLFGSLFFHLLSASAEEATLATMIGMSLEELLDMPVITASKTPQRLRESAGTVRVITAEQIRHRGYLTLEDLFSDLPGFQFRNIQGFNSYVFLRGAPNQNNLILLMVDGVEINELNSGGFYGGGQFNLENIKRVEVVYGPSSTLYGTNAMSGVINIITRDVDDEDAQQTRVSVASGNFDTQLTDFRSAHYDNERQFGYSLSGRYFSSEKADLAGAEGDNNWTEQMENFEDDISLDGKIRYVNFDFGLVFQNKKASRTTNFKTIDSNSLDRDTLWHIRFLNLWGKHDYLFSDQLSLKSKVYFQDATVNNDTVAFIQTMNDNSNCTTGPEGCQLGFYRPNKSWGIEEQLNYQPNTNLQLVFGLVYERDDLSSSFSRAYSSSITEPPPKPNEPEHLDNRHAGAYMQAEYRLNEEFIMTLGLRRDDSDIYGKADTPRFVLLYNQKALTWKLVYSEAFRAPRRWDLTFGTGNPALKPEDMKSLETSIGYQFNKHFNSELALYHNHISNKLIIDDIANRWVNQGGLNTQGAEIVFNYVTDQLSAYLNYTYTDSEDENGTRTTEIAQNTLNIGTTLAVNQHTRINLRANYLGSKQNPDVITTTGSDIIDSAFVFHTTLDYDNYYGWDFQLIVRNLLDEEYYHSSNRPPDRYRQPQRNWLVKAAYTF